MQLVLILAVVCALAPGDESPGEPTGGALWRMGLTLLGMLVAPLVATRRARNDGAIAVAWLAVVGLTMYALQWPRVVRSDWALGTWPLVDELCILVPVVGPLALLWAIGYQRQWRTAFRSARERGETVPRWQPLVHLGRQAREHLTMVLLPVLTVIGAYEFVLLVWPAETGSGEAWWLFGPLLAAMLLLLPLVLVRLWPTEPLPQGPLRKRLEHVCRTQGTSICQILVWRTDTANAAVMGMVPGLRYVLLTEGLLARLDDEEVETVLRHELGHVVHGHLVWRLLVLALPLVAWVAAAALFPDLAADLSQQLTTLGIPASLQTTLLVPTLLAAYAVLVVGRYSRCLEHEADLATCRNDSSSAEAVQADDGSGVDGPLSLWVRVYKVPPAVTTTFDPHRVEHFASALLKVVGPHPASRLAEWLHPSVHQRIALLDLAIRRPQRALAICRHLHRLKRLIVACYGAIAVVVLLAELWR